MRFHWLTFLILISDHDSSTDSGELYWNKKSSAAIEESSSSSTVDSDTPPTKATAKAKQKKVSAGTAKSIPIVWNPGPFAMLNNSIFKGKAPDYRTHSTEHCMPVEFFKQFLKDCMIQSLVVTTNAYSVEQQGKSIDVSQKEMEQYIGILFHMGIVIMPNVDNYWQHEHYYPTIAAVMPLRRFKQIKRFFHICNNNDLVNVPRNKYDLLFRFRKLYDHVLTNCRALDVPEHLSIDEQTIPFKGKQSRMKMYNKAKPKKWGFKVYALCCSSTGLILNFDLYTGNLIGRSH